MGHGVVSTASYEARKQGVRSGMAGMFVLDPTPNPFIINGLHTEFIARKLCPELVVVSTHFPRYMEISNKVMDIFRRYDPNMQPGGCDEGYLKYVICFQDSCSLSYCVVILPVSLNIVKLIYSLRTNVSRKCAISYTRRLVLRSALVLHRIRLSCRFQWLR